MAFKVGTEMQLVMWAGSEVLPVCNFDTQDLPGEVAKCEGCGSFEVKHSMGKVALCNACYEAMYMTEDMVNSRLLGILIEVESSIGILRSSFASPTTKKCLDIAIEKIEEGKLLLKEEDTANVQKEKD